MVNGRQTLKTNLFELFALTAMGSKIHTAQIHMSVCLLMFTHSLMLRGDRDTKILFLHAHLLALWRGSEEDTGWLVCYMTVSAHSCPCVH